MNPKVLLGIALSASIAAGCSKPKDTVTIDTPEGKATISTQASSGGGTVNVETPEGSMRMEGKEGEFSMTTTDKEGKTSTITAGSAFDVSELGVPIYPGSTLIADGPAQTKVDGPNGKILGDTRETVDPPAKVGEFFKGQLKDNTSFAHEDTVVVTGKSSAGDHVSVTAMRDKDSGKTKVIIAVTKTKG